VSNRGATRVSARETDSGHGYPALFRSRGALDLTPEYLSAAALRMMTLKFERGNDPEAKIMDGYHRRSMIKGAFCSIASLSMGSITSNKVTSRTLDSGATLLAANRDESLAEPWISPIPKKTYPREPKVPAFQDQSGQEMIRQKIVDYTAAHRRAYKQIVASLENLQKPGRYGYYGRWFDQTYNEERKKKVIANLARMANWMADYSVVYINTSEKCDERFYDKLAWTYIKPPLGPIHLCWRAFDDFWLFNEGGLEGKDWARAFIVIHEVSHAAAQTEDVSRNWLYCIHTSLMSSDDKVRNAQNYALFAMETDTSRFAYVPEGEIDLKTGDKIQLIANNNQFFAIKYEAPHYLVTDPHSPNDFTVTVDDNDPSTICLHERNDRGDLYLPDGTNGIACMPAANIPNDRWRRFKAGEFEVYKGTDQNGEIKTEKLLVLQARNGNLLNLNNENFIVADSHDVDQRCLFKLIKVR
jgi:hypothetical protein